MEAYGAIRVEAGDVALGQSGEAHADEAAPTILGLRSRTAIALGLTAGVALAGTAALAATAGAPLVAKLQANLASK